MGGPLVGLHDVKLGAVVATNLISITVVVTISVPIVTTSVLSRHRNHVESGDTATVALAEVNIIINCTTEEVRGVELSGVQIWGITEVTTVVKSDVQSVTRGLA